MRKLFRIFLAAMLLLCTVRSATLAHAQQTAVPEEARRYYVQANTLFRTAQSKTDFQQAAAMYRQALAVDPQYGNAWYNLSKVQEKLEQYDDAIASLKQFLAVSPNDPEARAAQDHEYELEALKGKAESPEAIWEKFLQSLEGGVWYSEVDRTGPRTIMPILVIRNKMLIWETVFWDNGHADPDPSQISNSPDYQVEDGEHHQVTDRRFSFVPTTSRQACPMAVDISETGDTITQIYTCHGRDWVTKYLRQR